VIEVDSALYHGALIDQEADRARSAELQATGWQVERFTDSDVYFRPQHTVDRLRAIVKASPRPSPSGT
jgi:very-short-patch-repair endonuclease